MRGTVRASMTKSPEEYLKQARLARREADAAKYDDQKEVFLTIAAQYETLAEQARHLEWTRAWLSRTRPKRPF
jgi:hypothetical protein